MAITKSSVSATETPAAYLRGGGGDLYRVRMQMDVEGNVNVPENPLVSRKSDQKLPIKSDAIFDYEERYHRTAHTAGAPVAALERYYHEARSHSLLNRNEQACKLRDSVRETVVRRDTLPEVIYAVDDYFHRDELELLRLPVSSAAVDLLLPEKTVTQGSRYSPSRDALVSVLNLSSVEASDVTAEVVLLTAAEARIQFRGKVDGSVEGVPTVLRTIGKLTFDRVAETCTWLAMAVHETREIGKAEPGFDIAATVKMVRKPLAQTMALAETRPQLEGPIPSGRLYVDMQSRELSISGLMDRRWRMMSDVPGAVMMRMIENDRSIAQCDFRSLVALEPGEQWTLEAFQSDVSQTLGEQLSELIEADERLSDSGLRVLRVAAAGSVQGVPIQWVMLHFSDDTGRRVLATFTMEGHHAEPFAGSDVQLASSLRFLELPTQNRQELTSPAPRSGESTRISKANSGEDSRDRVQSASDLR